MYLYIANTTVQVVDFLYRLSHEDRTGGGRIYGKAIRQIIQPGQQIRLTNDLSKIQIDDIVSHYTIYGMIEYREIDMTRGFAGLCFQVDQRMEADRLTELMLRNQRISVDNARQMREEAAIAAHAAIEQRQMEKLPDATLVHVDLEIEEVRSKNSNDESPLESHSMRVTTADDVGPGASQLKTNPGAQRFRGRQGRQGRG